MTENKPVPRAGLTVQMVSELTGYTPAQIALVARTVANGADLQELAVFLHNCRSLGLDPLLRQAYWIRRRQSDGSYRGTLQVGIDGFRAIADASGAYAGAEPIEFKGHVEWAYKGATLSVPELARACVWKLVGGRKNAFVGEAYWNEFVPNSDREAHMWAAKPRLMLGKCAEAQALRRAFPAQLGAVTMSEDADADAQVEVTREDPIARRERLAKKYDQIYGEEPKVELPAPAEDDEADEEDDVPDEDADDTDD